MQGHGGTPGRAWVSGGGASSVKGASQLRRVAGQAGGARADRTSNMDRMVVTLDVLKFSGWLNANAACRVKRGGRVEGGDGMRGAGEGGGGTAWGGSSGASRMQGGSQLRRLAGQGGARAERT